MNQYHMYGLEMRLHDKVHSWHAQDSGFYPQDWKKKKNMWKYFLHPKSFSTSRLAAWFTSRKGINMLDSFLIHAYLQSLSWSFGKLKFGSWTRCINYFMSLFPSFSARYRCREAASQEIVTLGLVTIKADAKVSHRSQLGLSLDYLLSKPINKTPLQII